VGLEAGCDPSLGVVDLRRLGVGSPRRPRRRRSPQLSARCSADSSPPMSRSGGGDAAGAEHWTPCPRLVRPNLPDNPAAGTACSLRSGCTAGVGLMRKN
jgi:hypothetical protein